MKYTCGNAQNTISMKQATFVINPSANVLFYYYQIGCTMTMCFVSDFVRVTCSLDISKLSTRSYRRLIQSHLTDDTDNECVGGFKSYFTWLFLSLVEPPFKRKKCCIE